MAGDAEAGIGLMQMEEGLDTGPVAREARTPIRSSDTSGDLTMRLSKLAASLLRESWDELKVGRLSFRAQPAEGVTYARKIEKTETPINWSLNSIAVRNHIHGLSPAPGAYSEIEIGATRERIKFLRVEVVEGRGAPGAILGNDFLVACGEGAIHVIEAQRAGKGPMGGADILRGGKPKVGDRFLPAEALRSVERSPS
jgi:methionyl-tRNA formyltransferase